MLLPLCGNVRLYLVSIAIRRVRVARKDEQADVYRAPVAWIYCSEVFPLRWRAKGVGLSAATNWAFNFAL